MSDRGPIKQIAVNFFIVFHLVAIVCWAVPLNTLLVSLVNYETRPYMVLTGLDQNWGLFAPIPLSLNCRVEAEITYADGFMTVWKFPLPQDFGHSYFKERDRNWGNSSIRMNANFALWPDAARYVARLNNNRSSPPASIKFVRYWAQIGPPGYHGPEPWENYAFFTYTVTPRDLQ